MRLAELALSDEFDTSWAHLAGSITTKINSRALIATSSHSTVKT